MFRRRLQGRFAQLNPLFDEGEENQGGNAPGNSGKQGDQSDKGTGDTGNQAEAAFQRLLDRTNGGAVTLAQQLYGENHGYRTRIRELEQRVPADGAVVLAGDDAAAWATYRELGAVADVQQRLGQLTILQTQEVDRARTATLAEAAALAGFDGDVLTGLVGTLAIEVRETDKKSADGKPIKAAFVIKDDKSAQPLDEYAAATWPKFMAALKPQTGRGAGLGTPSRELPKTQGQTNVQQPARKKLRF